MDWASLLRPQQPRDSFAGNHGASETFLSAASALAASNLNFPSSNGSLTMSAATLLQQLQGDPFLASQDLPRGPKDLGTNPLAPLQPEGALKHFFQNSTQGSSGHSTSQGSSRGRPHPPTLDCLATSSMVSSWKSQGERFPSQSPRHVAARPLDTAELLLQALHATSDQIPRKPSGLTGPDYGGTLDLLASPASCGAEILEALLIKGARGPSIPASTTSALLSRWLKDMEEKGGPRASGSPLAGARALGTSAELSAQLLSQTLPEAGSFGEGGLGSVGFTSGYSDGQADALNLALAQLSRAQVDTGLFSGEEGMLGKGSPPRLGGGVGGHMPRQPTPAGNCAMKSHSGQEEMLGMKPLGQSMGLSLEGSAGKGETRTEEDKRKRKLALNREAARRMRHRQAMRLEALEKTVLELQAANLATRTRLVDAERKVSELESRNEGLETRVVEVAQEILQQGQPSDALKGKLAALAQCLSVEALEKVPECAEGLQIGEVLEEKEGNESGKREQVGGKRKSSPWQALEEKIQLGFPHFDDEELVSLNGMKRNCSSGSSYEEESG